jgi:hypothetical protein
MMRMFAPREHEDIDVGSRKTHKRPARRMRGDGVALALLMAALVAVSALPGLAVAAGGAGDDGGSGGPDDGKIGPGDGPLTPGDRKVDVDAGPKQVVVTSKLQSGSGEDEFGFRFEATNQIRIELQYMNNGEGAQANIQMAVAFKQIIEFDDADGDGILGPEDEVVSTYDLEGAQYADFEYQTRTTLDGKTEDVITGSTADGVFKVVSHMAGTQTRVRSGELSPSWAKIDLVIEDFPYVREQTRLALKTQVETQAQVSVRKNATTAAYLGPDESGVEARTGDMVGYYAWLRTAEIDGAQRQVRSVTEQNGGTNVYLCYEHGQNITHDPRLGLPVGSSVTDGGFDLMAKALPYVLALGVGAVVVGAAVGWRRKKNGTA